MLPYHLLHALVTVVEQRGFHQAARSLHLTQSAVSQRIAALEQHFGERLLVRSTPPVLTDRGKELVAHVRRVCALEGDLQGETKEEPRATPLVVQLGINADSLATWFFDALSKSQCLDEILLSLVVDNEDYTFERMRQGEVLACISSSRRSLPGCESELLGHMHYVCCATPCFAKRHFPDGLTKQSVAKAPAVLFDEKDRVHYRFLSCCLGSSSIRFPHHYVPSSQGFYEIIARGFAYGVPPLLQATKDLQSGRIKQIKPGSKVTVALYWHYPRREAAWERNMRLRLVAAAKGLLCD